MSVIENRLREHGFELPPVAAPVASYIPAQQTGNLVFTSGQLPTVNGQLLAEGILGVDVDEVTAAKCAEQSVLNALSAIKAVIGDLDKIVKIVKVVGFVASAPTFTKQSVVVNGASDLLALAFGESAQHARSSVGMAVLPLNAPVEIELIVEVTQ